jgi:putative tricarboxylic transport membrane protein
MTDQHAAQREGPSSRRTSAPPPPPGSTAAAWPSSAPPDADVDRSASDRRAVQVGLFLLAVYVVVESRSLGLWSGFGPGPGFFPFVLGAGLGLLALIWFGQERRQDAHASPTGETVPLANVGVVLFSLVVLAAVMDLLGFQISMFAFLLFHLKWRAHRSWRLSLPIALVGSVGVFGGFTSGLLVALPQSSIPALSNLGL